MRARGLIGDITDDSVFGNKSARTAIRFPAVHVRSHHADECRFNPIPLFKCTVRCCDRVQDGCETRGIFHYTSYYTAFKLFTSAAEGFSGENVTREHVAGENRVYV